jgi:hypothetical protein
VLDTQTGMVGRGVNIRAVSIRPPQDLGVGMLNAASPTERRPLRGQYAARFYRVARLDPERYRRDFAKIAQEIVANLSAASGPTWSSRSRSVSSTRPAPQGGRPDRQRETPAVGLGWCHQNTLGQWLGGWAAR